MRCYIIGLFVCLMACVNVSAQVNLLFAPEINGRSIEGLGNFQVQNLSGKTISGNIRILVKENRTHSSVVTITTPLLQIAQGSLQFPRNQFVAAKLVFANNAISRLVSQTKNLPAGDYSFCYQFIAEVKTNGDDYENCYDAEIQPLVPISLISPDDRDHICDKRPALSWQPPLPYSAGMRFRILLTEKKAGESVENLLVNTPLIFLDNISVPSINYPAASPDLQEGKTYCWQVIAYQDGVVLSRSEIWEFTVQCKEPSKNITSDSYRELKLMANGNYYIADGAIHFAFSNAYHMRKLGYDIIDVDNSAKKMKNVPEVRLRDGLNKIDIDLSDLDMKVGRFYLLRVYPFNEPVIEIKFTYTDAK
jgi:hypothetical protein